MSKTKQKPARKEKTLIDAAKVEALCLARPTLKMVEKKGFVRFEAAEGIRVYVPKTKTVGRLDLSGFEMGPDVAGIFRLGGLSFGAVKQQVLFDRTEEEILATIAGVLDHMLTLPAREKKAKKQPGTPTAEAKPAAEKPAGKKSRKELIEKVAKEKGAKVSDKTQEEIA